MQGPKDSVAPCFNVLFVCVGKQLTDVCADLRRVDRPN